LYNRALEWLNLQDENKAIAVLKDMVEKYPGDKRGWGKLARLTPIKEIIDNAVRLGDDTLLCEIENANKSKEAAAQKACDEIRSGNGEKWLAQNIRYCGDFALDGKFSCVQDLIEESRTNADCFNKLMPSTNSMDAMKMRGRYIKELNVAWPGFDLTYGRSKAEKIIGNIFITSWDERDVGTLYQFHTTNMILTKDVIQRTFFELDRRLSKGLRFKNGLCTKCGIPKWEKGFLNKITYCPKCEKR